MRVRKLGPTGDFVFGGGRANFYVDQPEGVAQVVKTRLALWLGEWFLNLNEGTDWMGSVLGNRTAALRDPMIRARVLGTPGVTDIEGYSSTFEGNSRRYSVAFRLNTAYGPYGMLKASFVTPLPTPQPQPPAEPVDVVVDQTGDTSLSISWTPYTVPGS